MKKFLALLLAVVMVLSLAACGSEAPAQAPTEAPAEQPAETPAEQPAEEPTAEPVEEYTGPDTYSMIEGFDITSLFSVDTDALQSAFQFDSSKLQFDLSGAFTLHHS